MTDKPLPPDEKRCRGTYGAKYKKDPTKVGQRCEQETERGIEFCRNHRPLADHERCTGHLSKNHPTDPGGRCPNRRMDHQTVCYRHGGNSPQAKAGAQRREAEDKLERQVRRQLARLEVAPVDNPFTALAQLAGQVVAWKDALADHVNALTELRYEDAKGAEQLRSEVALFERALDRCNTVLTNMGRLNIDDRLAVINEKQAEKVIAAVDALLLHLGISGEQATEARRFLARKLRAA